MATAATATPQPTIPIDNQPWVRGALGFGATTLFALVLYAWLRWISGQAPPTPWVHDTALTVHLATVIPAIPLGAYVLLVKKGGPRHRFLGKTWLVLMFTTAVATLFVRNINDGGFSWIHLFTLLTFITIPRAYLSARGRNFVLHRKIMVVFYAGALLAAGITAFAPGRTMWLWAFGEPASAQPSHG